MTSHKIVPRAFATPPGGTKGLGSIFQRAAVVGAWCVAALLNIWCVAALYFDLPFPRVRLPGAVAYALFVTVAIFFARGVGWRLTICFGSFAFVLLWWLSLKPSNDRNWQADVAQTPWAEVNGDVVTI